MVQECAQIVTDSENPLESAVVQDCEHERGTKARSSLTKPSSFHCKTAPCWQVTVAEPEL